MNRVDLRFRYRLCDMMVCLLDQVPPQDCWYKADCPKAVQKPLKEERS